MTDARAVAERIVEPDDFRAGRHNMTTAEMATWLTLRWKGHHNEFMESEIIAALTRAHAAGRREGLEAA